MERQTNPVSSRGSWAKSEKEGSDDSQEIGDEDWIGMVCQRTSPAAIAEAAIQDAKFVCTRQYGDAPDVTLHGRLDLTFSCKPREYDPTVVIIR